MFDFIRNHSRLIQAIMFPLILLAFGLVGIQGYSRFTGDSATNVAKVAGHNVTQAAEGATVEIPYLRIEDTGEVFELREDVTTVGRGERRIFFIHLPRKCSIRVYTLSGHLVQTIEHDSSIDDGQEPWNLVSRDGMDIAYGIYAFHVDAPGVGETVGKFAIMK